MGEVGLDLSNLPPGTPVGFTLSRRQQGIRKSNFGKIQVSNILVYDACSNSLSHVI